MFCRTGRVRSHFEQAFIPNSVTEIASLASFLGVANFCKNLRLLLVKCWEIAEMWTVPNRVSAYWCCILNVNSFTSMVSSSLFCLVLKKFNSPAPIWVWLRWADGRMVGWTIAEWNTGHQPPRKLINNRVLSKHWNAWCLWGVENRILVGNSLQNPGFPILCLERFWYSTHKNDMIPCHH